MNWIYSLIIIGLTFAGEGEPREVRSLESEPAAQEKIRPNLDETERFEQSYPLNANGRVSVSNINGAIVVEAWDRSEVRLEATKRASSKEALAEIDLRIDSDPSRFTLEVDLTRTRSYRDRETAGKRYSEVEIKLSVPRGALLDEIEAVNGSVTVSNFTNLTKVSAVNGAVNATNLRGTANLSTVNGEVKCDFDSIERDSKVALSTVNGRVTLSLPSDVNATLRADTLNGRIENDFGLPVRKGEYVGRDLHGRIGSGEVEIKLNSVNGQLVINRKADGKNPNPVTDLLPQTGRSTAGATSNRSDHLNRSIDRSVRESQREAAAAMRDAQREIEKIKPELDKLKLKDLEKLKVQIDEEAIKESIEKAMMDQREAFERMREANWLSGVPRLERVTKTFPVSGVPKVIVDAKSCDVSVRGWDRPEVRYTLTEVSLRRADGQPKIDERATASEVHLTVTEPEDGQKENIWFGRPAYRLEVFVPRKADLTILSEGQIRIGGVAGKIDVSGADESIDIRDSEGQLKIKAEDSQIRVVAFRGSVESDTNDGAMFLDGDFSAIRASAVDGAVTLTLPESANASITSNTAIRSEHPKTVVQREGAVRLGSGGPNYNFNLAEGLLTLRSSDSINLR